MFDTTNVVNWSKRLKMWLMRNRRNHQGPQDILTTRQQQSVQNTKWNSRKDTCVGSIYESVQVVTEALEIVEQ